MTLSLPNPFDDIYQKGLWGGKFSSGPGSHHPPLVNAYIDYFRNFIEEKNFAKKAIIVDIGCGDFNVGKNLVNDCKSLIGIDTSAGIIHLNKNKYKFSNASFLHLDASIDTLPPGDIAVLRQVLQHLNNQTILTILKNIESSSFKWLVVTEHIPSLSFTANIDHTKSCHQTRLEVKSGVDIEQEPFCTKYMEKQLLLSYYGFGGIIQTMAYRLK